ncbi:MAG: sigma 54-interacting transcriptional regulator, partial [Candidatus Rokuibacteriota bacterium]
MSRALHARSPRRGARFAPVNCGLLGGELVRSELFGHANFTGAIAPRAGVLRAARRGTVFFDEIGRLLLARTRGLRRPPLSRRRSRRWCPCRQRR